MYEGQPPAGARRVAVNTEWGAFGGAGSLDIIRTRQANTIKDTTLIQVFF